MGLDKLRQEGPKKYDDVMHPICVILSLLILLHADVFLKPSRANILVHVLVRTNPIDGSICAIKLEPVYIGHHCVLALHVCCATLAVSMSRTIFS